MDNSIKKVTEEFEEMKNRLFSEVLEEIDYGSKIYTVEEKNDDALKQVVDRNSRNNMIAISKAKDSLDVTDPESLNSLKELIVKQSIYDSIKQELLEEKVEANTK